MTIPKNRRADGEYINSLARGLAVLRVFSRDRPEMTLSEVAADAELSPAVARRCLHTLEHLGYVGRRGKLFLLRPEIMTFASAYLESMNLAEVVRPQLQEIRDRTGDSSSLAVLSQNDILYLVCWRRVKTDHLCRLKIDQALSRAAYYASVSRSRVNNPASPPPRNQDLRSVI